MEKRVRKYHYSLLFDVDKIEHLKSVHCIYHLLVHATDICGNEIIKGYICFNYARTKNSVENNLNVKRVIPIYEKSFEIYKEMIENDKFWEQGDPPKREKSSSKTNDDTMVKIISQVLKHTEKMVKTTVEQSTEVIKASTIQNQQLIHELAKTIMLTNNTMTNSNNNNTNSNNKITNINVFLNEECKDAITLKEFIEKIVIEDSDIVRIRDKGYVDSVVYKMTEELKTYDLKKRPIHCSDIKREMMHIKDQTGWTRESASDSKPINNAIARISQFQSRKMTDYYSKIDTEIGSRGFEEQAKVMYNISTGGGNPELYNKKIMKQLVEKIYLNMKELNNETL